jgi:hypothetical protein
MLRAADPVDPLAMTLGDRKNFVTNTCKFGPSGLEKKDRIADITYSNTDNGEDLSCRIALTRTLSAEEARNFLRKTWVPGFYAFSIRIGDSHLEGCRKKGGLLKMTEAGYPPLGPKDWDAFENSVPENRRYLARVFRDVLTGKPRAKKTPVEAIACDEFLKFGIWYHGGYDAE